MKKKKKDAAKTVVYCGPTIPYLVRQYSCFANGILPDELNKLVESNPIFKEFIVSINELSATKKQLNNPHSPISACYRKAQSVLKTRR